MMRAARIVPIYISESTRLHLSPITSPPSLYFGTELCYDYFHADEYIPSVADDEGAINARIRCARQWDPAKLSDHFNFNHHPHCVGERKHDYEYQINCRTTHTVDLRST